MPNSGLDANAAGGEAVIRQLAEIGQRLQPADVGLAPRLVTSPEEAVVAGFAWRPSHAAGLLPGAALAMRRGKERKPCF